MPIVGSMRAARSALYIRFDRVGPLFGRLTLDANYSSSAGIWCLQYRSRWQASFQYSRRFAKLCSVASDSTNKPPRLIARDAISAYQVSYLNVMS
jgi:hypothetical protein